MWIQVCLKTESYTIVQQSALILLNGVRPTLERYKTVLFPAKNCVKRKTLKKEKKWNCIGSPPIL